MTDIALEYEWEAPGGSRGPELRATWARFEILIGGQCVTWMEDQANRSVRRAIYGPLYPIAEWITTNWWPLLFEVSTPRKITTRAYDRSHNLRHAGEGFALPDLAFYPDGKRVVAQWRGDSHPLKKLAFLGSGKTELERDSFERTLRGFLGAVVDRLDAHGIQDTLLQEEWKAIEQADAEERAYCEALGRLGADPYAVPAQDAGDYLIALADMLPGDMLEEFSATTDLDHIQREGAALERLLAQGRAMQLDLPPLAAMRDELLATTPLVEGQQDAPWQQGYDAARTLRCILATNQNVATIDGLGKVLQLSPGAWHAAVQSWPLPNNAISAALTPAQGGSPCFSIRSANEPGRVFALCRALFEFLADPDPQRPALVTATNSGRQKRNRAFAAEFLAPAATIRGLVGPAPLVSAEDVQDLAEQFGTSELVIRHQLANHKIAAVQEWIES